MQQPPIATLRLKTEQRRRDPYSDASGLSEAPQPLISVEYAIKPITSSVWTGAPMSQRRMSNQQLTRLAQDLIKASAEIERRATADPSLDKRMEITKAAIRALDQARARAVFRKMLLDRALGVAVAAGTVWVFLACCGLV